MNKILTIIFHGELMTKREVNFIKEIYSKEKTNPLVHQKKKFLIKKLKLKNLVK